MSTITQPKGYSMFCNNTPTAFESKRSKQQTMNTQPTKRKATARCAYCGKRHKVRPAYVGYESGALCFRCEKELRQ
jgi:hypothetical protein